MGKWRTKYNGQRKSPYHMGLWCDLSYKNKVDKIIKHIKKEDKMFNRSKLIRVALDNVIKNYNIVIRGDKRI